MQIDDLIFGDGDLSPRARRIRHHIVTLWFAALVFWIVGPLSLLRFVWLCMAIAGMRNFRRDR